MQDRVEHTVGELMVRVDRDLCISSSNCIKVAPGVFELDDKQICTFKNHLSDPGGERILEACRVCPVEALIVVDHDNRQLVP